MDIAKNFARGTVRQGYSSSAVSIALLTGEGSKFPDPPFNLTWWNASDYDEAADDPNKEIIRVVSLVGDVFTIARGQEGTTATSKSITGKIYKVSQTFTAKWMNEDLMPQVLESKGDMVGFSTEPIRVPVGTPGTSPVADPGAEAGWKWANVSGGGGATKSEFFVANLAALRAVTSASTNIFAKVRADADGYSREYWWDNSTATPDVIPTDFDGSGGWVY